MMTEMRSDELMEVNGGVGFLLVLAWIAAANATYNFGKGVVDGYNE